MSAPIWTRLYPWRASVARPIWRAFALSSFHNRIFTA